MEETHQAACHFVEEIENGELSPKDFEIKPVIV